MNNAPRVLLIGARGRMGQAVTAAAAKEPSLTIKAELGRGDPIVSKIDDCNVVIDFSTADATEAVCRACAEHCKALVLGSTGHSATQKELIMATARQIPIVFAANFSVGVNALFALTRRAAELLGGEFDVNVIEMHHRTKKDSPSGTAKRLVEILTEAGGPDRPISTQSIRAGDIVGDHTVIFAGPGERLELTHRASSRETFAAGALRAARWVIGQPAGLYSMENVHRFIKMDALLWGWASVGRHSAESGSARHCKSRIASGSKESRPTELSRKVFGARRSPVDESGHCARGKSWRPASLPNDCARPYLHVTGGVAAVSFFGPLRNRAGRVRGRRGEVSQRRS